ncbi:MAG TPA: type VI secretion system ATPase TssH [Thermoanaerobaculia bacterium]|jgi:type VI secretion system protein VasG|nr:type VI secretion system ATPase TssH [Thermoanaerobaculia bacterium]
MSSELRTLINRLNPVCKRALETAAALCVAQTHYNVEVEHLLLKLLDLPATDVAPVLRYFNVDQGELQRQLTAAVDKFDRGNSRTPAMSPQILRLLREGWSHSSLALESPAIRSGGLLLAIYEDDSLRATIHESCPILARVSRESLRETIRELVRESAEETAAPIGPSEARAATGGGTSTEPAKGQNTALDRYTFDLTADARAGKIDPIRGRDSEIRQVIDILTRRRQNNPILVGDAGVGKTAVAEGFALRIASGDVPEPLRNVSVRILDLALLQAGAGVKGEFEERLKSVINEVKGAAKPIVLFIDEAHTMIGAGGQAGQGDAANLLKPALARGELRTIAATTWSEYKKYFEKDPALTRRFQVVKVDEPDEEAALDMLRGLAPHLEKHHKVQILDEAVRSSVALSHRYLAERRLPDKAIGVLDTAAARVALAQEGTPAAVEDLDRRIRIAEAELEIRKREGEAPGRGATAEELEQELAQLRTDRTSVGDRWKKELELVKQIRADEKQNTGPALQPARASQNGAAGTGGPAGEPALRSSLRSELDALQQQDPMVPIAVDSRVVASVVSGWTGIPVGRMLADEIRSVMTLKERMAERIVGQPQALDAICRRISTSRAALEDPSKPKGVFLLVGPTGVGKTETALTLADLLYGGERNLISFNMSEFQEAHSVATLKGAPPGYVGYGKGGVLTEAVRRKPWSAVLLDEIEKAHPDVVDLFYQVFDKGMLEDGEGVPVDFKHTVILLTSNAGASVIEELCADPKGKRDTESVVEQLRPALLRHFRPALLARLVIVPYFPLRKREVSRIVELKLRSIKQRVKENHAAELTYDPGLVESLTDRCKPESGAREIDQILTQTLLPELSTRILERMANGVSFSKIHISVDEMGKFI